jgi:hypothetical protein
MYEVKRYHYDKLSKIERAERKEEKEVKRLQELPSIELGKIINYHKGRGTPSLQS